MKGPAMGLVMIAAALGIGALVISKNSAAQGGGMLRLIAGHTYSFTFRTDDLQVDADAAAALLTPAGFEVISVTPRDDQGFLWAATCVWRGDLGALATLQGAQILSMNEQQV